MKAKRKLPLRGRRLGRDAWILAARDALIEGGIAAVKIGRLVETLRAERGSFYHHFKDRDALLQELRKYWETTNSRTYENALDLQKSNKIKDIHKVIAMWADDSTYDSSFDSAMRDWARVEPKVALTVRRIDEKRISALTNIFNRLGFDGDLAVIRARITYFHQMGYLAIGLAESKQRRRKLAPLYLDVLLDN